MPRKLIGIDPKTGAPIFELIPSSTEPLTVNPSSTLTSEKMDENLRELENKREENEIRFVGQKSNEDKNQILTELYASVSQYIPVQDKGNILASWRNTLKF